MIKQLFENLQIGESFSIVLKKSTHDLVTLSIAFHGSDKGPFAPVVATGTTEEIETSIDQIIVELGKLKAPQKGIKVSTVAEEKETESPAAKAKKEAQEKAAAKGKEEAPKADTPLVAMVKEIQVIVRSHGVEKIEDLRGDEKYRQLLDICDKYIKENKSSKIRNELQLTRTEISQKMARARMEDDDPEEMPAIPPQNAEPEPEEAEVIQMEQPQKPFPQNHEAAVNAHFVPEAPVQEEPIEFDNDFANQFDQAMEEPEDNIQDFDPMQ